MAFFLETIPELPDISLQISPKLCKTSHKRELFCEKMTSGNPEVEYLVGAWRKVPGICMLYTHFPNESLHAKRPIDWYKNGKVLFSFHLTKITFHTSSKLQKNAK